MTEDLPNGAPTDQLADAGLLIIHGVGEHSRTAVLDEFVGPLLDRLAIEGKLISSTALQIADPSGLGDNFGGVRVRHSDPQTPREVLVIEALWSDTYIQAGRDRVSPWVASHSPELIFELIRFNARGWTRAFATIVAAAAWGLSGVMLHQGQGLAAGGTFAFGLLLALGIALFDDVDLDDGAAEAAGMGRVAMWLHRLAAVGKDPSVIPLLFTLLVYQVQRALILLVLLAGFVIFPVLVVILRLVASLPFLAGLWDGMLGNIEALFATGGVADMFAITDDQISAAEIQTRVSGALLELEQQVAPGGVIAVLGHSAGATLAWWLLEDAQTTVREQVTGAQHPYHLLTVAGAINWVLHGFAGYATPLELPLAHTDSATVPPTKWLNLYATWDPVPHGPIRQGDLGMARLGGWTTWSDFDDTAPNRAVRNLGAPVPEEHGEYWQNQHEFVPALWRAIVDDSSWAVDAAGRDSQLWSNYRLAILSALVRTRLAIVAVPIAAVLAMFDGRKFVGSGGYHSVALSAVSAQFQLILQSFLGTDAVSGIHAALNAVPLLGVAITLAILVFVAYALTDVYMNFFWQGLGRSIASVLPAVANGCSAGCMRATLLATLAWVPALVGMPAALYLARVPSLPAGALVVTVSALLGLLEFAGFYAKRNEPCWSPAVPALATWVPSLVLVPALLALFSLGWFAWGTILALNTVMAASEIYWMFGCLRALGSPERKARAAAVQGAQGAAVSTTAARTAPVAPSTLAGPPGAPVTSPASEPTAAAAAPATNPMASAQPIPPMVPRSAFESRIGRQLHAPKRDVLIATATSTGETGTTEN